MTEARVDQGGLYALGSLQPESRVDAAGGRDAVGRAIGTLEGEAVGSPGFVTV